MNIETLIMLDGRTKQAIPINVGLFSLAQFSREKKLNEKYSGNLVIYPTGAVKEISHVKITGYFGESLLSKLFSILNATYDIEVELIPSSLPEKDVVAKAIEYIKYDQESYDPYLPKQNLTTLSSLLAGSTAELYASLNLPSPEDCLDVMV